MNIGFCRLFAVYHSSHAVITHRFIAVETTVNRIFFDFEYYRNKIIKEQCPIHTEYNSELFC